MHPIMEKITDTLTDVIAGSDIPAYADAYQKQHEVLVVKDFLPADFVINTLVPEVETCTEHMHRVNVPKFKKSGSVSRQLLAKYAPNLDAIYRSEALMQFIAGVVGRDLVRCPERDPHAAALYYYTEPGDRIGLHYDKSFYKGKRFTVLLGLVQDSTHSKLVCYPGGTKKNPKQNRTDVMTHPGCLVVFNGDVLWHEVTALAENERRVILTLEYLTDQRMSPVYRWISEFKDRILYFGKAKAA